MPLAKGFVGAMCLLKPGLLDGPQPRPVAEAPTTSRRCSAASRVHLLPRGNDPAACATTWSWVRTSTSTVRLAPFTVKAMAAPPTMYSRAPQPGRSAGIPSKARALCGPRGRWLDVAACSGWVVLESLGGVVDVNAGHESLGLEVLSTESVMSVLTSRLRAISAAFRAALMSTSPLSRRQIRPSSSRMRNW